MSMFQQDDGTRFLNDISSAALGTAFNMMASGSSAKKTYKYNRKLMQQQAAYNREAAQIAYERQLAFYQRQVDDDRSYNDPTAVKQRYKDAGINPTAAFGTAGSYTPMQAPNLSSVRPADSFQAPYINGSMFQINPYDNYLKAAQAENIRANTDKVRGETIDEGLASEGKRLTNSLLSQEIIGKDISNQQERFDLDFAIESRPDNLSKLKQSVENMRKQADVLGAEYQRLMDEHERNPAVLEELKSRVWKNYQQVMLLEVQARAAEKGIHLTESQIEKLDKETRNLDSVKALLDAQAKHEKKSADLKLAQEQIYLVELSDTRNVGQFTRVVGRAKTYLWPFLKF
nr:MAG: DNA pilot protein [Microviridae sp.]